VLTQLKIKSIPVPVELIATKLGAKLSYEPFEGQDEISGMLFRDGDRIVIGVNSSHVNTRQRFTIAHEIGHLVLHKGAMFVDKTVRLNRDSKSSMAIDPKEIEANGFAAELLMPAEVVTEEARKRLTKKTRVSELQLVSTLATAFDVSTHAMEIRLTNLGIITPR
jgi:Zn-dependent peptidase ImmA (M78 family)